MNAFHKCFGTLWIAQAVAIFMAAGFMGAEEYGELLVLMFSAVFSILVGASILEGAYRSKFVMLIAGLVLIILVHSVIQSNPLHKNVWMSWVSKGVLVVAYFSPPVLTFFSLFLRGRFESGVSRSGWGKYLPIIAFPLLLAAVLLKLVFIMFRVGGFMDFSVLIFSVAASMFIPFGRRGAIVVAIAGFILLLVTGLAIWFVLAALAHR